MNSPECVGAAGCVSIRDGDKVCLFEAVPDYVDAMAIIALTGVADHCDTVLFGRARDSSRTTGGADKDTPVYGGQHKVSAIMMQMQCAVSRFLKYVLGPIQRWGKLLPGDLIVDSRQSGENHCENVIGRY